MQNLAPPQTSLYAARLEIYHSGFDEDPNLP